MRNAPEAGERPAGTERKGTKRGARGERGRGCSPAMRTQTVGRWVLAWIMRTEAGTTLGRRECSVNMVHVENAGAGLGSSRGEGRMRAVTTRDNRRLHLNRAHAD